MKLIKYELQNLLGNFLTIFFSIVFPTLMGLVIGSGVLMDTPEALRPDVGTAIFLSMIWLIPISAVFVGNASILSQEFENNVPLRIKLFGYQFREVLLAKAVAQFVTVGLGVIVFVAVNYKLLYVKKPSTGGVLSIMLYLVILVSLFFVLSYAIAHGFKKFSKTYAVTMSLYMGFMLLSGMMGVSTSKLPQGLKVVSDLIPTSHLVNEGTKIWLSKNYNYMSLIQSLVIFAAISAIVLVVSLTKGRKTA